MDDLPVTPDELAELDPHEAYKLGYRTAIKDVSGGESKDLGAGATTTPQGAIESKSTSPPTQLCEIAERALHDLIQRREFSDPNFKLHRQIILRAMQEALQTR